MNSYDFWMQIVPNLLLGVIGYFHFRNRPWVRDANRKIVRDRRLGKLDMCSIWCGNANGCSCKRRQRGL